MIRYIAGNATDLDCPWPWCNVGNKLELYGTIMDDFYIDMYYRCPGCKCVSELWKAEEWRKPKVMIYDKT